MKLVRWGPARAERWGVLDSAGAIRALPPSVVPGTREALTQDHIDRLADGDAATWPAAPPGVRLGPPVSGCGKIVCIGLNYRDHARESGMQGPPEPVVFMKATSAIIGQSGRKCAARMRYERPLRKKKK